MKRQMLGVCVLFAVFVIGDSYHHGDYCFLPQGVTPIEYDLWIDTNLNEGLYKGIVVITVKVSKVTPFITLHSRDLKVDYAFINLEEALIMEDKECDFLILKNPFSPIKKGIYNLTINFEGYALNKTFGFYQGHNWKNCRKQFFASTFFEPINARSAFPCFDEPQLKAEFSISMVRPLNKHAREILSNMDILKEQTSLRYGKQTEFFRKTPPMSTYLVMVFAGPAYFVENFLFRNETGEKVPMRVYTTSDSQLKRRDAEYAATQLPKIVKWFETYTGIDWLLPKLAKMDRKKYFINRYKPLLICSCTQKTRKVMCYCFNSPFVGRRLGNPQDIDSCVPTA